MNFSRAYKFRLIPTLKQAEQISQIAGSCRFIFNLALEQRNLLWDNGRKNISYVDQANELPALKKEVDWLSIPPAQCLQQALMDLNRAFINFFQGIAKHPVFKKKGDGDSFRFPDPTQFVIRYLTRRIGVIKLPKIGEIKFIKSRDIEGRIRNVTVKKDGKDWNISINCEIDLEVPENHGTQIGADRGIIQTISLSSNIGYAQEDLSLPTDNIKNIEKRISHLQKVLSGKVKFSANWRKIKIKIGKLFKKITRIRHDFLHKISTKMTHNHSLIVLEDLKIKNMSKSAHGTMEDPGKNVSAKSGLNRSILRQGWFKFQTFLEYKSKWFGSYILYVPPHYTSQTCSQCSYRDSENRKSQSEFECIRCKYKDNADTNAAKNILTLGQRGRACGDTDVSRVDEAGTSNMFFSC